MTQAAGHGAVDIARDENHVFDPMAADGFQQAQALFREGLPGVAVIVLAVRKEHDAGHDEFDPGGAVDKPLEQGLFLFLVEDAPIVRRQVALRPAVGDEPLDIAVGEGVPVAH
ncbi:hypothetical protein D3C84_968540 [compost metagenome]